jgi:hypothetical protein
MKKQMNFFLDSTTYINSLKKTLVAAGNQEITKFFQYYIFKFLSTGQK